MGPEEQDQHRGAAQSWARQNGCPKPKFGCPLVVQQGKFGQDILPASPSVTGIAPSSITTQYLREREAPGYCSAGVGLAPGAV